MHVRRPYAAPLGGTQGAEAGRCTGPQHAQGGLVTHQKSQARRGHRAPAQCRQFEGGNRAEALEQRGIGFTQSVRRRVAKRVVQSLQPGHRTAPCWGFLVKVRGCHASITKDSQG
ncbi:hypothetical protein D3C80_1340130 [compost metagenome]